MLKVYFLPVSRTDGADVVAGIEYIHGGVLSVEGTGRKLIQATTPDEDFFLSTLSSTSRKATEDEIAEFEAVKREFPVPPPSRDLANEIDDLKGRVEGLEGL